MTVIRGRKPEELEKRLVTGYELIERKREAGEDVTKLEDFWIALLQEYEEAVEEYGEEST